MNANQSKPEQKTSTQNKDLVSSLVKHLTLNAQALESCDDEGQIQSLYADIAKTSQLLYNTYGTASVEVTPEQASYLEKVEWDGSIGAVLSHVERDLKAAGVNAPWEKFSSAVGMTKSDEKDSVTFGLFPIPKEDEEDWEFFCAQEVQFWTAKELDYARDRREFPTLKPRYQELYMDLLGFFAPGDGLISASVIRFINETKRFSSQAFLIIQLAIELVHAEGYGLSITSIIPDEKEQEKVLKQVDTLPCVQAKANYIKELVESDRPLAEREMAAACTEGVFFVGLFNIIFYMKSRGVMKTFAFLNKQVSQDETLHRDRFMAACKRHGSVEQSRALEIVTRAVDIEIDHMKYILRKPIDSKEEDEMMGLTVENMSNYIKSLADQVLVGCGCATHYNVGQIDMPWMNDLATVKRTNFYEVQTNGYKRMNKAKAVDWRTRVGLVDETATEPVVQPKSTSAAVANPDEVDF